MRVRVDAFARCVFAFPLRCACLSFYVSMLALARLHNRSFALAPPPSPSPDPRVFSSEACREYAGRFCAQRIVACFPRSSLASVVSVHVQDVVHTSC